MPQPDRYCARCKRTKPAVLFGKGQSWCKACHNTYASNYYHSGRNGKSVRGPIHTPADGSDHDADLIAYGEAIVRQCPRAGDAVDAITSGWGAMNKGNP